MLIMSSAITAATSSIAAPVTPGATPPEPLVASLSKEVRRIRPASYALFPQTVLATPTALVPP